METDPPTTQRETTKKPPRGPVWIRVLIFAVAGAVFAYEREWGVAVLAWGVGAVVWWISKEMQSRRRTPN